MRKIKLFSGSILQRKLPYNFDDNNPAFKFFKELSVEDIPEIWLHSFTNVSVDSDSVVRQKGEIQYEIFEFCLEKKYKQQTKEQSLSMNKLMKPRVFASTVLYNIKNFVRQIRSNSTLSPNKKYLLITDDRANNNFYHWINEAMLRLMALDGLPTDSILLLPEDCWKYEYVRNSLKVFNITEDNIQIIPKSLKVKVEKLDVISCSMLAPGACNYLLMLKIRDKMTNFYRDQLTLDLGDKIYISRERSKHRKVNNENEVMSFLSTYGFKKICAEDYSLIELISIMLHTKYFVGMVSAGLTHMMFMKEGGFVMELIHKDFVCPTDLLWPGGYTEKYSGVNYYSMANALGLDYLYQPCMRAKIDNYIAADDIIVDIDQLKTNIELMISVNNFQSQV